MSASTSAREVGRGDDGDGPLLSGAMGDTSYRALKTDDSHKDMAGETQFDEVDSAIKQQRATSTVRIFFSETKHLEQQHQLASVIETYKRYLLKMDNICQEVKAWRLCCIERSFSATTDFPREVLAWFSSAVDSVFPPVPEAKVLDLVEDLRRLQESKFGSTPATLREWGEARKVAGDQDEPKMFVDERKALISHALKSLQGTKQKFKDSPMLCWFLNGLLHATSVGRYEFLGAHALVPLQSQIKRKTCLQWTVFGMVASQLVSKGYCLSEDFQSTEFVDMFEELDTVTVPIFILRLNSLEGIMVVQNTKVLGYKAKLLGVATTLAITMGHAAVAYGSIVVNRLHHPEAEGDSGH